MVAPAFLVLQDDDAFDAQVVCYRYVNGPNLEQVGSPFSTARPSSSSYPYPPNRVAHFAGALWASTIEGIYKYTPSSGAWTQEHAYVDAPTTSGQYGTIHGPYAYFEANGNPFLVSYYTRNSGAGALVFYDYLNNTWSETVLGASIGTRGGGVRSSILYNGQLFTVTFKGGTDSVYVDFIDIQAGTITEILIGDNCSSGEFAVLNNTLYLCVTRASQFRVLEFSGGFSEVDAVAGISADHTVGSACFATGNKLNIIFCGTGGAGQRIFFYTFEPGPGLSADLSDPVLPAVWRASSGFDALVRTVTDSNTDPEVPVTYVFIKGEQANPWTMLEFVDDASQMLNNGTGGAPTHSLPQGIVGGDRVWSDGELDVLVVARDGVPGAEQVTYRLWGDPGVDDKIVKGFYQTQGEADFAQMTLIGTATGNVSQRVGNEIQDADADDGATDYTFDWDAPTDGIAAGQRVQVILEVSIP